MDNERKEDACRPASIPESVSEAMWCFYSLDCLKSAPGNFPDLVCDRAHTRVCVCKRDRETDWDDGWWVGR